MQDVIQTWQPLIQQEIDRIISEFAAQNTRYLLDAQQLEYLKKFATKGKQFRGCLLAGFCDQLKQLSAEEKKTIVRLAAALELYGSAILIQDDIIDQSQMRRGIDSVHTHMEGVAQRSELQFSREFGVASAICLANVLYFIADTVVAELRLPAEIKSQLAVINGRELALVSLAEIEDVRLASSNAPFSKEEIFKMFAGKTGGYTGKWPLALACVMCGIVDKKISDIGEKIGVLYQLKDDELGIFGDELQTGKSNTADLVEGKKTLYYWYLQQLPNEEKGKAFEFIGNISAPSQELQTVKDVIEDTGIRQKVAEEIIEVRKNLEKEIADLSIRASAREFLLNIVEFVVNRTK